MKFQYRLLLSGLVLLLLGGCARSPRDQWKCTAVNTSQEHWVQYGPTRAEAAIRVRDRCRAASYRAACYVRCIPPIVRWHCVAIDKEGHLWYWNSRSKYVAIRNARRECSNNTTVGGCRVLISNCSMT